MSIKAVNSLSHYTDWTIGHVHSGALGWVGMITFGAIYYPGAEAAGTASGSIRCAWSTGTSGSPPLGIVDLRRRDVGRRHPAGPDVARIRCAGLPRLFVRGNRRSDVPLLRDRARWAACCTSPAALIMAYNVTMTILGHQRDESGDPHGRVPALQPAE